MPMYTYLCDECDLEKDIVCSIAERDEPKKEEHQPKNSSNGVVCSGTFRRGDNVEITASTPYAWKP